MTQIIKPKEPKLQLADILQNHIADYQKAYPLSVISGIKRAA